MLMFNTCQHYYYLQTLNIIIVRRAICSQAAPATGLALIRFGSVRHAVVPGGEHLPRSRVSQPLAASICRSRVSRWRR